MILIQSLEEIGDADRAGFGHKAWALGEMARQGFNVPPGVGISAEVYRAYIDETGLRERIELIVRRKRFQDMRWEELWDASLRVRNLFLTTSVPPHLRDGLISELEARIGNRTVAVRSSAPGEDSAAASFAGLHDSYLNVAGADAIIEHVRKVWASLWSDAALAYRRNSEPTLASATMAVIVQELIAGSASGVAFGEAPDDPQHVVVESVHGLNEGLVDGSVEPDRWILSRADGSLLRHDPAHRKRMVAATSAGVRFESLSAEQTAAPPLHPDQLAQVFGLVGRLGTLFGSPQDVEWTFAENRLFVLQSRPITARRGESPVAGSVDGRSWSSSLRKSLDYLVPLRKRVETELMPALREDARTLGEQDPRALSDEELSAEIRLRLDALRRWETTYAEELIPLAHAIRLFGLFYNETVQPADPYEFLGLLAATPMEGLRRNRLLEELAAQVRGDAALVRTLRGTPASEAALPESFTRQLDAFLDDFGHLSWGQERCFADRQAVIRHVLQLCEKPSAAGAARAPDPKTLGDRFLSRFQGGERDTATELLDLARAAYRLRDDDNIALGGIRARVLEAADEGRRRLSDRPWADRVSLAAEEVARALADPAFEPSAAPSESGAGVGEREQRFKLRARQIVGQPAGPGVATGKARVVLSRSELFDFRSGEILVCDAIEPNMTFVVPLAAAVVERRGGMLIHGAIIAREYGLPCVTGIPDATASIHTGDTVTVDGHLGIVTVG